MVVAAPADVPVAVVFAGVAVYLVVTAAGRSPWHLPTTTLEARQLAAAAVIFIGFALALFVPVLSVVTVVGAAFLLVVLLQRHRAGEPILFHLGRIRR